jgi:hypothetical protein
MAVGDELSVYVELLNQGRTSLKLKAEALARERDGDGETGGRKASLPSSRSTKRQAARDCGREEKYA